MIDAPTAGMATSTVETVVSIPGERVPGNMAFDTDGNLYLGITAGEVRRLSAATASLTVWAIWALWHVPLFFVPGSPQGDLRPVRPARRRDPGVVGRARVA